MRSASSSESERAETFAGDRAACIPVRRVAEVGWLGRSAHQDTTRTLTNQPGFAVSLGSGIGFAIAVVCRGTRGKVGREVSLGAPRRQKAFYCAADEKLSAFIELERQVLTGTFYLESIQ